MLTHDQCLPLIVHELIAALCPVTLHHGVALQQSNTVVVKKWYMFGMRDNIL